MSRNLNISKNIFLIVTMLLMIAGSINMFFNYENLIIDIIRPFSTIMFILIAVVLSMAAVIYYFTTFEDYLDITNLAKNILPANILSILLSGFLIHLGAIDLFSIDFSTELMIMIYAFTIITSTIVVSYIIRSKLRKNPGYKEYYSFLILLTPFLILAFIPSFQAYLLIIFLTIIIGLASSLLINRVYAKEE